MVRSAHSLLEDEGEWIGCGTTATVLSSMDSFVQDESQVCQASPYQRSFTDR